MSSIFVSHSHEDNTWCREFVADLRARGADAWYDEHNMGFGALREEIERELRSRTVFIVVLSPAAITSGWVQREVDAAIHLQDQHPGRIFLPVVAQKCDVPLLWLTYKRVSGAGDTGLTPQEAAGRVVHVLGIPAPSATPVAPTPVATPVAPTPAPTTVVPPPVVKQSSPPMQPRPRKPRQSVHAITDLYDEERHIILVQYPVWLVLSLIVTGIITFALTGFLGYKDGFQNDSDTVYAIFKQGWPLFLWFCALLIVLQLSIFRDKTFRSQLIAILIMTTLSMVTVGIINFYRLDFLSLLTGSTYLYVFINFGILAVFWIGALRDVWLLTRRKVQPRKTLKILQVTSWYLIAGAILTFLLSFIFEWQIISPFVHPNGVIIDSCTVSWPIGACGVGGINPPTLSFLDLIQTLLYLPLGILLLALTATVRGLSVLRGESANHEREPSITLFVKNLLLQFRFVVWPALLFLAIFALASTAKFTRIYLHLQSDVNTCGGPQGLCKPTLDAFGWPYQYLLYGLLFGIISLLCMIFATSLLAASQRVIGNTLRCVGLVAGVALISVWGVALGLSALNGLLKLIGITVREPFPPFGIVTLVSLAAFIVFIVVLRIRRRRNAAIKAIPGN